MRSTTAVCSIAHIMSVVAINIVNVLFQLFCSRTVCILMTFRICCANSFPCSIGSASSIGSIAIFNSAEVVLIVDFRGRNNAQRTVYIILIILYYIAVQLDCVGKFIKRIHRHCFRRIFNGLPAVCVSLQFGSTILAIRLFLDRIRQCSCGLPWCCFSCNSSYSCKLSVCTVLIYPVVCQHVNVDRQAIIDNNTVTLNQLTGQIIEDIKCIAVLRPVINRSITINRRFIYIVFVNLTISCPVCIHHTNRNGAAPCP